VLPGPGGLGGIPSGEHIVLKLTHPDPSSFYVEIIKTAEPKALEIYQTHQRNLTTKVTPTGWEVTYDSPRTSDGQGTIKNAVFYADLAGGHYTCRYMDINCPDKAAAEAICRSMLSK
jgi:hypothetical protein